LRALLADYSIKRKSLQITQVNPSPGPAWNQIFQHFSSSPRYPCRSWPTRFRRWSNIWCQRIWQGGLTLDEHVHFGFAAATSRSWKGFLCHFRPSWTPKTYTFEPTTQVPWKARAVAGTLLAMVATLNQRSTRMS
jgi:hypothetical protein